MSDEEHSSDQVGYGKPPSGHRFKPGQSGNPKGKPRKRKSERAITPRQVRRDFFEVAEQKVTVSTARGEKEMTARQAILMMFFKKALQGHGPSMRYVCDNYERLVEEHYLTHERTFNKLEEFEVAFTLSEINRESEHTLEWINLMRKLTCRV